MGGGFQPAMVRAHSRASAVSVMPGNSRRSSTAADNSPPRSKAARIGYTPLLIAVYAGERLNPASRGEGKAASAASRTTGGGAAGAGDDRSKIARAPAGWTTRRSAAGLSACVLVEILPIGGNSHGP